VTVIVLVFVGYGALVRLGSAPARVHVAISFIPPKLDIQIERRSD
jgi:hypothetical protein